MDALSKREVEVIGLVCEGRSNLEIGKLLGIKEGSVKQHLTLVYKKTKIKNRKQLMFKHFRRELDQYFPFNFFAAQK